MSISNKNVNMSCKSSSSTSSSNNPNTANNAAMKYGDADVCSKRRKLLQQERETINNASAAAIAAATLAENDNDYLHFERIASENCLLNSSFQDFKGGLVENTTPSSSVSLLSPLPSYQHLSSTTCSSIAEENEAFEHGAADFRAKNNLIITTKPSLCSKGFENTFKILQSQVENNIQKTLNLMQSINPDSSFITSLLSIPSSWEMESPSASSSSGVLRAGLMSKSSEEEPPTRLDLELEAMQRMRSLLINVKLEHHNNIVTIKRKHEVKDDCDSTTTISTPLLSLLYDFVSKGQKSNGDSQSSMISSADEAAYSLQTNLDNDTTTSTDFIYHASKSIDGKNCLRTVRTLLRDRVLCGNRVSQMTRAYDDIEAVTRLLEEKEKDLELTVQIGKELLTQNNHLENRINELETDLKSANDDRAQLIHELHKKNELISVLTSDADDGSENDTPTLSKSITLDLMQKKIATLQDENKSLKLEATQLATQTDEVEEHERRLVEDITTQLNDANSQFDNLNLDLERQREENRLQHEQIVSLTARLAEAEMRLHQLTHDNDEHITLLNITKENQNSLAMELVEFKQRYQEVLALLQETQEQLRNQRKKALPQARSSYISSMGLLQPESLQSELMESSLYSENSLDSGISGDNIRANDRIGRLMSQLPGTYGGASGAAGSAYAMGAAGVVAGGIVPPYKRVFETVRSASKSGNFALDNGNPSSQLGAMSMSSSSGPRMSATANMSASSFYRSSSGYDGASMGVKTLSCESLASASDDGYPAAPSGVPGAPGAKDLEAALKRLTPAEVLARRAMLSYAPVGSYNYDEPTQQATLPHGIRTPDSIMSTGSSGISSSATNMSASMQQWRLPDKLQIVKPMEGSQTLHHWSRLATPTLSGLLEERPGVTIRGGRGLDDLGLQVYTLSDVEEDVSDDLPGKQFEASGCTYTYTTSMIMHPDDGLINDLSFLSQSQMSSRMASASTSRQPSCPPTPRGGLSRKNSCSTFSVNLSLAGMLNERGIKAVTPSALNTPAGPNFTPTVTPCNSPEGSPPRSHSPEPLFGLLSSGADMIRRKLVGDFERPNRNQQKQQKIMLSRLERRALRSLKLVEKVESIGLENIIAAQPNAMSQLASGIASRSGSPMSQLTSLKHIHTNVNNIVDDIHFDRDQIKGVLHKGLNSPRATHAEMSSEGSGSSCSSSHSERKPAATSTKFSTPQHSSSSKSSKGPGEGGDDAQSANSTSTAPSHSTSSTSLTQQNSTVESRVKQMQRQKSRRSLKNGISTQRPDLGTIGCARVRNDLGRVAGAKSVGGGSDSSSSSGNAAALASAAAAAKQDKPREPQSYTQAFVGSVSSLLFGRKGGWL